MRMATAAKAEEMEEVLREEIGMTSVLHSFHWSFYDCAATREEIERENSETRKRMECEAQERKVAIQETEIKLKLASSRRDVLAEKARGLYEASLAANIEKEAMTSK